MEMGTNSCRIVNIIVTINVELTMIVTMNCNYNLKACTAATHVSHKTTTTRKTSHGGTWPPHTDDQLSVTHTE